MKILTVVGARPQFIKAATLTRRLNSSEFQKLGLEEVIVNTGQHYDDNLSKVFFDELEISEPTYNLGVGSGTQAEQTSRSLIGLEAALKNEEPDLVLIYGDTNATLAGALAAAKGGIPLAHVEAGLRSFRRGMPEEVNRLVADRLSDFLFCPTNQAVINLRNEGRVAGVHLVGDIMLDGFLFTLGKIDCNSIWQSYGLSRGEYALATIHRAESTDIPGRLACLMEGLSLFAEQLPVILPMHPRTRAAAKSAGFAIPPGITVIDPVPYSEIVALLSGAAVVATDSGGLQKEACFAQVPCVTLREETEWKETIESGWNRLPALNAASIAANMKDAMVKPATSPPNFGNGDAAGKILSLIADRFPA